MVSLLGLRRGTVHTTSHGGAWRAPAPVRQLFWRVRSRLRNAVLLRPRRGTARFGYDLQSYSQNFDDGVVSGYRF